MVVVRCGGGEKVQVRNSRVGSEAVRPGRLSPEPEPTRSAGGPYDPGPVRGAKTNREPRRSTHTANEQRRSTRMRERVSTVASSAVQGRCCW